MGNSETRIRATHKRKSEAQKAALHNARQALPLRGWNQENEHSVSGSKANRIGDSKAEIARIRKHVENMQNQLQKERVNYNTVHKHAQSLERSLEPLEATLKAPCHSTECALQEQYKLRRTLLKRTKLLEEAQNASDDSSVLKLRLASARRTMQKKLRHGSYL